MRNVSALRPADPNDVAKEQLIVEADKTLLTERFHRLSGKTVGANILWVDDKDPYANIRERRVLNAAGFIIDMASLHGRCIALVERIEI